MKRVFFSCLLSFISTIGMFGQSERSPLQGFTPPQVTPGSPEGSFPLSGFDTINPANRSLNFVLNLHTVKGRGTLAIPINLTLSTLWSIKSAPFCYGTSQGVGCTQWGNSFFPTNNWWNEGSAQFIRYMPVWARLRQSGDNQTRIVSGSQIGPDFYGRTNTQITLVMPDRTELDFRDAKTSGKFDETGDNAPDPQTAFVPLGVDRGRIFTTVDH